MKNFDILQVLYAYETRGLIHAIKILYSIIEINTIVWAYKNIKLVRNIIVKRSCKQSPYLKMVLDLFVYGFNDPNYYKTIIKRLPKKMQKQYVKFMLKYKHGKNKRYTV